MSLPETVPFDPNVKAPTVLLGPAPSRIDLGCGPNKREGFFGIDQYAMKNVDLVLDIGKEPWPFADSSIEEAHSSHFVEHLDARARAHFMNELDRVLKPDAKALIITPFWASGRAYGDLTHVWPPVSEMFFFYLNRQWRLTQAPHTDIEWNPQGLSCNFDFTCSYNLHESLASRNVEYQQRAVLFDKEAAQDIVASLTAKK